MFFVDLDKVSEQILVEASKYTGKQMVTVEYLAQKCGISKSVIYQKMHDDNFRAAFIQILRRSLLPEVPAVLDSLLSQAIVGGSYKHQELVLKLAGVYTDEKKVTLEGRVKTGDNPFKSREEAAEFLQNAAKRVVEES